MDSGDILQERGFVQRFPKGLPKLNNDIKLKSDHLDRLLQREADLATSISRSESFEELENLIIELNDKFRKKGEYESVIKQLHDSESNLEELNQSLDNIDDLLFSHEFEKKIKEQVVKFNRFFSAISQTLYGEQYALKVDPVVNKKGQRLYRFSAFNTNFSSGKKQGKSLVLILLTHFLLIKKTSPASIFY